jgi:MYXO-CTERM domain-containing protein
MAIGAVAVSSLLWMGPGVDALSVSSDSVHASHRAARPRAGHRFVRELDPPSEAVEFTTWVYGYYASWAGEVGDLPWDRLTHVAIFDVELTSTGELTRTSNWTSRAAEAVALAEPYGVKVHLAVTCFSASVMAQVLDDPNKRVAAADALAQLVDDYGGHGVSVDFEGMDAAQRDGLIAFVGEVKQRVDEVTVATPAVDWNGAYDYDALVAASDGLFIMGYDYHWRTGDPGPVAPLVGGTPWGQYSLEWSLTDYETWGAPPEDVILGLPLYGYSWPSTSTNVPGAATGQADSVLYADAAAEVDGYGRQFDDITTTPYYFPSSSRQNWYDDLESLDAKIGWAVEQGVRGIGFWAVNYEGGDPAFWDMVALHTQAEVPPEEGSTGEIGDETGLPPDSGGTTGGPEPETTDGSSTGGPLGPFPPQGEADESGCACGVQDSGRGRGRWVAALWLIGLWVRRRTARPN